MHTSFEDLRLKDGREGSIGRMIDGELIWERARTPREAGYSNWSVLWALLICGIPGDLTLLYLWLAH